MKLDSPGCNSSRLSIADKNPREGNEDKGIYERFNPLYTAYCSTLRKAGLRYFRAVLAAESPVNLARDNRASKKLSQVGFFSLLLPVLIAVSDLPLFSGGSYSAP